MKFTLKNKKNNFIRSAACLLLCGAVLAGFSACQPDESNTDSDEKTVITMLYPTKLPEFEALLESTYTDIDLQIEINAVATINGQSERRLLNGHGTDIVTVLTPSANVSDYLADLSEMEYTSRYSSQVMRSYMVNGQAKYIPLPGQYSGYIYNSTIAKELGFDKIESRSDLLALLDAGSKAGKGTGEDGTLFSVYATDLGSLGSYYIGNHVPDYLAQSEGIIWSDNIKQGNGSFTGAFDNALDFPMKLVEAGYFDPYTLEGQSTHVIERMENGTMLLTYGGVSLYDTIRNEGKDYEYEMIPFLSDEGNQPWTVSAPCAFLGINASLEQDSPQKLDACHRMLSLLSTAEGQEALIKDIGAAQTYLTEGVENSGEVPDGLKSCIDGGYIYNIRIPTDLVCYIANRFDRVLLGSAELPAVLEQFDDYYYSGGEEINSDVSIVGWVEHDMICENYNVRLGETEIGNLVSDAVREAAEADIGFINGGSIRSSLYEGDVLGADLDMVCPYDNKIVVLKTNGKVIREMLENGVSQLVRDNDIPSGRFLNVSGMCYSFDPETGEITSMTLPDGTPIKDSDEFTIAVTDYMAGNKGYIEDSGDGYTMLNVYSDTAPLAQDVQLVRETGLNCADVLGKYFAAHKAEGFDTRIEGRITSSK